MNFIQRFIAIVLFMSLINAVERINGQGIPAIALVIFAIFFAAITYESKRR